MAAETVSDPVPGPDEVAIQVHATAVGLANIPRIAGKYRNGAEPPFTPGAKIARGIGAVGTITRPASPVFLASI